MFHSFNDGYFYDPAESFSILPVKIIVANGSEDTQAPEITFVAPSDTSTTVAVDSFTIDLLCIDASGLASVSAALGATTYQSNLKNGHYLIPVKGFIKGTMNIVTITAKDSSASGNTNTRNLYFNYTTPTPPFTVTYNGNTNTAGAPPIDPGKYEIGAAVTVKDNTGNMVKVGYTFIGWNTATNGSGTAYASGVTFPMGTANVTLYAQWTIKPTLIVTYNGNGNTGGTVPVDVNKYVTAATVTIKDNKGLLVKTGTSFAGWNTAADGIGTAHVSGATFPMSSVNVTLYAKWTTNPTFTVTYNGNANSSGTVPADANKYETAATVTVKDNTGLLVKTGSTFTGWNTAADGSGIPYAAAATFPMGSANVTLYAQWTLKPTFSVTYNGNGNSGVDVPSDTTKYETSATVTVKNNTGSLVRTGFTFTGWNTAADGSGTARAAGATFPMGNANVTLYAIWKKNECTITFDGQGATTAPLPASKTVNAGSAAGVLPVPGKTSYIFKGWWTGLNGTGTLLIETTPVELNVTVYAYWIIQDIDGNTYTEIRIGTQVWMVENLKTTRFNDGAMIKNVINAGDWNFPDTSAYCWYENNTLNKQRYGALYNFSAVVNPRKLAPAGWHVPTDGEVQTLFNYLIDNGFNYDGTRTGNMFAKALASKQNWNVSDVTGSPGKDLSTNNKSLFSAEPGGYRGYDGFYGDLEISTFFWTSSEMMNFSIHNDDPQTYMDPSYRGLGHSVRCLRDW